MGANSAEAHVAVQVSDIAALLLERVDNWPTRMTLAIQNAVAPYQKGRRRP